jgi:hypothetical protein|tara:strand:- start:1480 stop:1728 length:249 start_codon:yes stop_codon:yes gene_type:complete
MAINSEKIVGKQIINEIKSSNLSKTIYHLDDKTLTVTFKNGTEYRYQDVPHKIYTKFRLSESQGRFFNTEISKKFKYEKLTK